MRELSNYFKNEVRYALWGKPHLIPVFSNALCTPERLHEYDPSFFVAYNSKDESFEIHSLDNKDGNTYCATLPYKRLDARAERYVRRNDVRVHGRAIIERIEKSEEQAKKRQERDFKNWVQAVAGETQSMFAKDAWTEL